MFSFSLLTANVLNWLAADYKSVAVDSSQAFQWQVLCPYVKGCFLLPGAQAPLRCSPYFEVAIYTDPSLTKLATPTIYSANNYCPPGGSAQGSAITIPDTMFGDYIIQAKFGSSSASLTNFGPPLHFNVLPRQSHQRCFRAKLNRTMR